MPHKFKKNLILVGRLEGRCCIFSTWRRVIRIWKDNRKMLDAKKRNNNVYKLLEKMVANEGISQSGVGEENLSESRWSRQWKTAKIAWRPLLHFELLMVCMFNWRIFIFGGSEVGKVFFLNGDICFRCYVGDFLSLKLQLEFGWHLRKYSIKLEIVEIGATIFTRL